MLDLNLEGKNAIVGGASKGIGKAVAVELSKMGANVTILARNEEKLKDTLALLDTTKNQSHSYLKADYSQPTQLLAAIENHLFRNPRPVHIVVNNTGGPPPGPANSAIADDFLAAFQQHLLCNHLIMQAVLPGMKEQGYGRIINVISTSVKIPIPNLGVSNTIRAAVANWSKTLANELASFGITVNNVLPGSTDTDRLQAIIKTREETTGQDQKTIQASMMKEIPAGRFGLPEEIAYAVVFLASPAAGYINGINLPVDGGRTGSL
jgi:3-oxoacyl-[acyl-carrier protein] reductase